MKIVFGIIAPSVIGVFALIIFFAALSDKKLPLISGDRPAFIALMILNFVICFLGPIPWTKPGGWLSPFHIALYILAGFALLLVIIVITIKTLSLPIVSTYRKAYIIIAIIFFFKWAVISAKFIVSISLP